MLLKLCRRMATEIGLRPLGRFAISVGWKGMLALRLFRRHVANGVVFPPFMFLSVTNRCNLKCEGCWVTPTDPPKDLDTPVLEDIIAECVRAGSHFFGLLGGEPLLYPGLFDILGRHRDCYFQVFTNGTPLTEEVARRMRRLGNVTPLISIEGLEEESDRRRGGRNVYKQAMQALAYCRENRLLTGVASSICRSNIAELASLSFVEGMISCGAHYLWYYIYRPSGSRPASDQALDADQVLELRRFMVDIRSKVPLMIIDAYWDHAGRALCPAACGVSHHINPSGDIEPCPPIQFARDNVHDGGGLFDMVTRSDFLRDFRRMAGETTSGCVLLERPDVLSEFLRRHDARPTGGRPDGLGEIEAMVSCPGHHQPGREIPERHWLYSLAKRNWFFGFGAYG